MAVELYTSYYPKIVTITDEEIQRMVVIMKTLQSPVRNLYLECIQYSDSLVYIVTDSRRIMKTLYLKDFSTLSEEELFQNSLVLPSELNLDIVQAVQEKFHEFNSRSTEHFKEMVQYIF